MARRNTLGRISVDFVAGTKGFRADVKQAGRAMDKFRRPVRRTGRAMSKTRRGFKGSQMALLQLSTAVEDGASVWGTTGFAGAVRAASNNLSQAASLMNPLAGIAVGLGAALGSILIPKLFDTAEASKQARKELEEFEAGLDRIRSRSESGRQAAQFGQRINESLRRVQRGQFAKPQLQNVRGIAGEIRKEIAGVTQDLKFEQQVLQRVQDRQLTAKNAKQREAVAERAAGIQEKIIRLQTKRKQLEDQLTAAQRAQLKLQVQARTEQSQLQRARSRDIARQQRTQREAERQRRREQQQQFRETLRAGVARIEQQTRAPRQQRRERRRQLSGDLAARQQLLKAAQNEGLLTDEQFRELRSQVQQQFLRQSRQMEVEGLGRRLEGLQRRRQLLQMRRGERTPAAPANQALQSGTASGISAIFRAARQGSARDKNAEINRKIHEINKRMETIQQRQLELMLESDVVISGGEETP